MGAGSWQGPHWALMAAPNISRGSWQPRAELCLGPVLGLARAGCCPLHAPQAVLASGHCLHSGPSSPRTGQDSHRPRASWQKKANAVCTQQAGTREEKQLQQRRRGILRVPSSAAQGWGCPALSFPPSRLQTVHELGDSSVSPVCPSGQQMPTLLLGPPVGWTHCGRSPRLPGPPSLPLPVAGAASRAGQCPSRGGCRRAQQRQGH